MAEQGTGTTPVSDRFFLAAIALYILLTLALLVHVATKLGGPVPHAGLGRVAVDDWPLRSAW